MREHFWQNGERGVQRWFDSEMTAIGRHAILVVEDDPDIRELLATLLDLSGFEVHACANAVDALEQLRGAQFDLILTDYALPDHTGAWLLQQATEEGLLDATAVLVVTAHPQPQGTEGFEVISKPFDLDDLVERVRRRLNRQDGVRRRPVRHPTGQDPASSHRSNNGDGPCPEPIDLILYVSADSPHSAAAIENIKRVLAQYGADKVKLTICDLGSEPGRKNGDGVAFTPTLVKRSPGPRTCILGHISNPQLLIDLLDSCDE